jgi:hypothetical protein
MTAGSGMDRTNRNQSPKLARYLAPAWTAVSLLLGHSRIIVQNRICAARPAAFATRGVKICPGRTGSCMKHRQKPGFFLPHLPII